MAVYGVSSSNAQDYVALSLKFKAQIEELFGKYSSTGDATSNENILQKSAQELLFDNYFVDYLEEAMKKDWEIKISKEDLSGKLKQLIAEDTDEGDNSEEIAALTNLIADFGAYSRGEDYITADTLLSSVELSA